ncbi:MAG: hypothetical protein ACR2QC_10775 [Gammaproteobacteria bacterium]
MKHAVKTTLVAAMLAMSPSAFAADTTQVVGGLGLAGLSGWYWQNGKSDAEDDVDACIAQRRATNSPGTCSSDYGTERLVGIIGIIIGGALAVNGLTDDDSAPDYFTRNGLVMDGMTFGYTDTGKVGLQKKWEF